MFCKFALVKISYMVLIHHRVFIPENSWIGHSYVYVKHLADYKDKEKF